MSNNQLLASDNFGSGSLASGWSTYFAASQTGTVIISSPNVVQAAVLNTTDGQVWTGTTFPRDQISEVTVGAFASNANVTLSLIVRADQVGKNGYQVNITNGGATFFSL